jgi:hypothetical protein
MFDSCQCKLVSTSSRAAGRAAEVVDHDAGAELCKLERVHFAQTVAGASDYHNFVVERHFCY